MSQTLRLGDIDIDEARLAELCQRYQVRELPVFGSAARGEMRPDSDIDPLVEFLPNADVGRSLGKWILKASASQSWLKCGWRVAMPGPSRPQTLSGKACDSIQRETRNSRHGAVYTS